jgi:hypothetical protein
MIYASEQEFARHGLKDFTDLATVTRVAEPQAA